MPRQTLTSQITEGVIWKQLLAFFFPILLGAFFQQMYNTADAIIVGRFVGTQALAAVGSTSAFVNLINGFFIGVSTGATVITSQFFGAKDLDGTEKALHTGVQGRHTGLYPLLFRQRQAGFLRRIRRLLGGHGVKAAG